MRISLLHGFAGDRLTWASTTAAWDGPAPVAIALPGHGGGPVLATWEANLDAVAAAIGDAPLVVGYSLGARVALGLVATGRVPRAILIGGHPGLPDVDRPARRASDAEWVKLLRERGIAEFVDAWQAQPLFASQARVPPERLAARRRRRLELDPEQLARSLEVMGLADMPDYRSAIRADRIALITGADDAKFCAIARSLPAPLEVIPDSGHDIPLEQPVALARAIRSLT